MTHLFRLLCLTTALGGISGCGADFASRMAYGALGGMQQQTCIESPAARKQDCLQTESYDEYQRKRQEMGAPR